MFDLTDFAQRLGTHSQSRTLKTIVSGCQTLIPELFWAASRRSATRFEDLDLVWELGSVAQAARASGGLVAASGVCGGLSGKKFNLGD